MRKPLVLAVVSLVGLASLGCSSSPASSPSSSPPSSSPSGSAASADGGTVLPIGKSNLPLVAGRYRSPAGFRPSLGLTVPAGWSSVHRGADAFDLGRPDPTRDAPLVAIVLLTPAEPTAAAALAAVRTRVTGNAVNATLAGVPAEGLEFTGGTGTLIASSGGGIALDAVPGQRGRLLAADIAGRPVVCVVLVPDAGQWDAVWPEASAIIDSLVRPSG